jgi:hypothetical protein
MEKISRFVALVFFIGVAFVGAINNDFFVFGISSHTKEFLKNMATPELPVKLCILVYGFYFAILILRTMLNKLRELLRGLFIVNDDLDRLKIVATKRLQIKAAIKRAEEKEEILHQGKIYNIKYSKLIFKFVYPTIIYTNEFNQIIPQKIKISYKSLYQLPEGNYFLYIMYESGFIKIETLTKEQADDWMLNKRYKNVLNNDKGAAEIPISYELNGIKRIPVTLPIWSASSFNNNNLPDLTCEFAELMGFIASVAVDIRMYSSYGGGFRLDIEQDTSSSQAADDLKYLSHILHNLHMFQDKNCENIIFACEQHIDMYKSYMSTETFKRHKKYADLNKAIKVFEQIKTKCRCSVS